MDRLDEIKDKFKDLGVLAGADVVWLFVKIKDLQQKNEFLEKAHKTNINIADNMKEERNQYKRLAEYYARIINGMISNAEEIKRLMLRANESYTNNEYYEVNWNILKVLDMLREIEV